MNPNQLAIIIAFYFSKFDKEGIRKLGFTTDSEAFEKSAQILGIKKNYIKFRRDEFDPIHPWRKGWQRPMDNRIIRAIEALQDLPEVDLREIVQKILTDNDYRKSEELFRITSLFTEDKKRKKSDGVYVLRGPTGRMAEEYFIDYFNRFGLPIPGILVDTRELGCGYDFEIKGTQIYFIEVKGVSQEKGGILFTNKEWITALKYKERYILAFVSNVKENPTIKFISNPTEKFSPKKNVVTTVQIQWSVSAKEL